MNKKIYAKSKYIRMSPQKVRLVVDMIRGENAQYAVEMLEFVNKAAALPVRKVIESAIANAEHNDEKEAESLIIVEARVDEAPIYKRGRAVSKGRYHKILKRNCHIIVAVQDEQGKEVTKKKSTKKKVDAKKTQVKKSAAKKKIEIAKRDVKSNQVISKDTGRRVQSKG